MKIESKYIIEHLGNIDILILSSGFEDRCLCLSKKLNSQYVGNTIIFHMLDAYTQSETNKRIILDKFPNSIEINYDKNEQYLTYIIFLDNVLDFVNKYGNRVRIVLDCTGFSRDILLILLKVLQNDEIKNKIELIIAHTPAEKYDLRPDSTEKEEIKDELWLTKGVRRISPIVGYSGLITPSKKLLLIVLNGFENERTENIIGSIEPNALILGVPAKEGSINENLSCISIEKFSGIKNKFQNILKKEYEFSCTDLLSTVEVIENLYQEFKNDYNISVTPLNNKISTLAVALAAIRNENIQVCYASANQYNIEKKIIYSDYFLVYNLSAIWLA